MPLQTPAAGPAGHSPALRGIRFWEVRGAGNCWEEAFEGPGAAPCLCTPWLLTGPHLPVEGTSLLAELCRFSCRCGDLLWPLSLTMCRGLTQQPVTRPCSHLLATTITQPLTHSSVPVKWGGEWEKVELVGWDKESLIRQQKNYYYYYYYYYWIWKTNNTQ